MLKLKKELPGHQNPVYALAQGNDSNLFFTAGNDKGVVEWSLENLAFSKVLLPVQSSVYCLRTYHDLLFIGERSGSFVAYDLKDAQVTNRINAHAKPIFDIQIVSVKNELLTASEDGSVAVWSLSNFEEIYRFQIAFETIRTMAISPDQTEIAFGCKDHQIYIYNLADYSLKRVLEGHESAVTSLAYHPSGEYLISGGRDAQLKIWDLPSYESRQNIPAHLFAVYRIAFHPSLPYFATCSQDKSIKLWDAESFKLYKILSLDKGTGGHSHSINALLWSDDGKCLISTGDDRKVMIWELTN
ncbi:MAG: WD40 repeat domain-containing protein [Pedobacter sp.]|nr:MAG: WD40 repeat domain-containing protein [Pedobacter sp.]